MCLDRAIVTAGANLNNSVWTNSQIKNGFSRSRKLQQLEAEKLYAAAGVEINDCGNTLEDVKKFALHLGIQLNIVDADQFDIFMAGDLRDGGVVYLLKSKNHYDVITSMSGFLSKAYYWHTCKVFYSRRNTHKYESKYKCCFNFSFCSVADSLIVWKNCNRFFRGQGCYDEHKRVRGTIEEVKDILCGRVAKCLKCERVITTGLKDHICGFEKCKNCKTYADPHERKCFMGRTMCKGGYCISPHCKPKRRCYLCRTRTKKYMFYDFEGKQETGEHIVNLAVAKDFNGMKRVVVPQYRRVLQMGLQRRA